MKGFVTDTYYDHLNVDKNCYYSIYSCYCQVIYDDLIYTRKSANSVSTLLQLVSWTCDIALKNQIIIVVFCMKKGYLRFVFPIL